MINFATYCCSNRLLFRIKANVLVLAFDATNAVNFQDKSISGEYYEEWCNEIRFGSYRTAAKLRALQHRTGLVHIDIWNMIALVTRCSKSVVPLASRVTAVAEIA